MRSCRPNAPYTAIAAAMMPPITAGQMLDGLRAEWVRLNWVHGYGPDARAGFDPVTGLLWSLSRRPN